MRRPAVPRSAFPPCDLASERFLRSRGACLQTGLMPLSASGGLSTFAVRPYPCVWPSRLATGLGTLFATARDLSANQPAAVQRFGRSFRVRHSAVPVRLAFPPRDLASEHFPRPRGACLQIGLPPLSASGGLLRSPSGCTRAFALPALRLASERFGRPRGTCLQTSLPPFGASGGLLRAHGCLACVCGTRLQLRQQPQRRCRHVSHAVRGHFPASKRHPAAAPKPRHVPALCCGLPAAKPCGVSTRRAVLPFSGALRLRARLPSLSLTEKA